MRPLTVHGPFPRPAILEQYEGRWVALIVERPNTYEERVVEVIADAATSSELVRKLRAMDGEVNCRIEYVMPATDTVLVP